jgi:tRNA-uridine 2-sulfurtransferase
MNFPLELKPEMHRSIPAGASVLLGISGGVDSSVALALLKHLGCEVHCVTLKNFCLEDSAYGADDNKSCCSLEAIESSKRLAARFDSDHMVSNVEVNFKEYVIDPFVSTYSAGMTPNPCIDCNTFVRFPKLLQLADMMGCDYVATGHYVRVIDGFLHKGIDIGKDQAYFLYGLTPEMLKRCIFPLGWNVKPDVRAAALELGMDAAKRADSQEICFIPDDDRSFLFDKQSSGDIVTLDGTVVGTHRGLIHYTIGQRRGLGVALGEPVYVKEVDMKNNQLVVGKKSDLLVNKITCNRISGSFLGEATVAQVRHNHIGAPVAKYVVDADTLIVDFEVPEAGVAPGQSLVLFDDDKVVGGGVIVNAEME